MTGTAFPDVSDVPRSPMTTASMLLASMGIAEGSMEAVGRLDCVGGEDGDTVKDGEVVGYGVAPCDRVPDTDGVLVVVGVKEGVGVPPTEGLPIPGALTKGASTKLLSSVFVVVV